MTAAGEKGLGVTLNVGSEKPWWAVGRRRGQITSVCMQSTDGRPKEEQVKGPHSAISKVQDMGDCRTNHLFSNKLQENEKGEVGKPMEQ